MTENTLVASLISQLRQRARSFVVFKHHERTTHGVPDISATGGGLTSWWEVKFAAPDFKLPGIQELTCKRLAHAGYCRFIVFDKEGQRILIVHPDNIAAWAFSYEMQILTFEFSQLIDAILRVHSCKN